MYDIEKMGPALLVNKLPLDWKIYKDCEITPPNPIKRVKEQLKYIEPDIRCVSEGHWNSKAHNGKNKTSWECTTQQSQTCLSSCLPKGGYWSRLLGERDCPAWAINSYCGHQLQKWGTKPFVTINPVWKTEKCPLQRTDDRGLWLEGIWCTSLVETKLI